MMGKIKKEMDKILLHKKGVTLAEMPQIGITLVITVLVLAAGAVALQSFKDSQTTSSFAANISSNGLTALSNTTSQFTTLGTVLGVVLIIGSILAIFAFKNLRE